MLNSKFVLGTYSVYYSRYKTIKQTDNWMEHNFQFKRTIVKLSEAEICLDVVKRYDYENFLSMLLLPKQARQAAISIRAFNIELAQAQELTSEKLMAQMRLQFWRETLDQIYQGSSPQQPIAKALFQAVKTHKLNKRWLRNLIESREDQLNRRFFSTLAEVEIHAEKSDSSIYFLILQSIGLEHIQADHAASHLGKAEGLVRLLRGISPLTRKRIVLLPREILVNNGVSEEEIFRGSREQKMKNVVFEIASLANYHIENARGLMKEVPVEGRIALLPAITFGSYLRALQIVDFDVFDSKLQVRNSWLPISLWWASFRNAY